MNTAENQLSNEEWAEALELFAQMVDGAEPASMIVGQNNPAVRVALENLWRQHKHAEKLRFLEDQITVVSELSAGGPVVFHPGQLLAGRFAILRILGRGGMGEVYLADDKRLMETVALKTIKRELARDKENRARFLTEVQNARRVTHPNVCRIFDLFEHEGVPFYSMEYVAGATLAEVLAAGPMDPRRARSLAIQSAEALWTAHKNGILHCDLKPANILLAGSGKNERAVITDFGLAHALGRAESLAAGSPPAGTPSYMAPELLQGETPSVRTDIYAFGKVLEALLPGARLGAECAAPEPNRRPASFELVLKELRGATFTRRNLLTGILVGASGLSLYLYDRSRRLNLHLTTSQRLRVNGFTPESGETAKMVRSLLIMALRQSPLLSVVGDRPYQIPEGKKIVNAGFALPIADLLATAREEKANLVIDGKLEPSRGGGLSLFVNLYDPAGSALVYTKHLEVENRLDVVDLAEMAATDLRSAFGESHTHSTYMPLAQITSSSPEALDCYFRAVSFEEKADADSARALLDRAIDIDPNFVLAYHYRAIALTARGRLERALASEETAYAKRLDVTERERNWIDGSYHNITGAWRESLEAYEKNTALFPDEALFHRQLAFAMMRCGRYNEAIPHNRRAIELDPFSEHNGSEYLENLAEANRVDECLAEVKRFAAEGRTSSLIHSNLALAYAQKEDFDRSLAESREFAASATAFESWARFLSLPPLIMSGRFVEAIQSLEGDLALEWSLPADQQNGVWTYMRRNTLGHLYLVKDQPGAATEQAEYLVQLPPLGANLVPLREGCALALQLQEFDLARKGLGSLRQLAERWPSSHSQSAVWLTEGLLKDAAGGGGANQLLAKAKGAWPDPINLFHVARFEGRNGLFDDQLASLQELERMRGKVYKYHFAGLVALGWLEQAKCLQSLSRFSDSLRMYQRVLDHWKNPQTAGNLIQQARQARDELQRRVG